MDQDSTGGPLPPHGHGPNNGGPRQVTAQPGQSFAGQSPVLPQGSFPPQDSFPPPTAKKPSRRIGAKSAAWALIILGLFGGGTATGWWAHRHFESTRPVDTVAAASGDDSSFLDTASTAMPDVRGLAEPVARQILADAGVAADRLTVESRPFAGLGGMIVEQDPPFGTADPGAVRLIVSAPAAVPEIAGRSESELVRELRELGTQVAIARRYQPGADSGTVSQIDPPSGSPLPETVTVTVAADPATAYLSDVEAAENRCGTGEYSLAGSDETDALSCSVADADARSPRGPVWEFDRAVEEVDLTVGLPTDADPGARVKVTVSADGRVLREVVVGYGETVRITHNTRDALTFSLLAVAESGEPRKLTVTGVVRGDRDAIITLTEK
ncbi:MAG TPA: PASTA domain-containing protein [Nocardia sp.]|uniref:PASTA domain-containing protein n=1 Tax=Nocardia TaxID=1817 RepID=UPI002457C6C8|nr:MULTISPECIES: PASTA domain-containing protein [Nocardia]HLS77098.1 PASTA domain-containing protein [Nocardia sp.]